jgi:hypothetical protein
MAILSNILTLVTIYHKFHIGDKCLVLKWFLYPSTLIQEKYNIIGFHDRHTKLVAIHQEEKQIQNMLVPCIIFWHGEDSPNTDVVYAQKQYVFS